MPDRIEVLTQKREAVRDALIEYRETLKEEVKHKRMEGKSEAGAQASITQVGAAMRVLYMENT